MMTMDMREIIKAIERLKEYTYSSIDDLGREYDEVFNPPRRRKATPTPQQPENLSDEEWNNLMSGIGTKV